MTPRLLLLLRFGAMATAPSTSPSLTGVHLAGEGAAVHFGPGMECTLSFKPGPPPYLESNCPISSPPPGPAPPPSTPPIIPPPAKPPLAPPDMPATLPLGTLPITALAGSRYKGFLDDFGLSARYERTRYLTAAPDGSAVYTYTTDAYGDASRIVVRRLDLTTTRVDTIAGGTNRAHVDGGGSVARFDEAWGTDLCMKVTEDGKTVFMAYGSKLRILDVAGCSSGTSYCAVVSTMTFNGESVASIGSGLGGMALSSGATANSGTLYFADTSRYQLKAIDLATSTVSVLAGQQSTQVCPPTGGVGTAARLCRMTFVVLNPAANMLYLGYRSTNGHPGGIQTFDIATNTVSAPLPVTGETLTVPRDAYLSPDARFMYIKKDSEPSWNVVYEVQLTGSNAYQTRLVPTSEGTPYSRQVEGGYATGFGYVFNPQDQSMRFFFADFYQIRQMGPAV